MALATVLLAAACAEIVYPTRADFYDWRLVVGVDSLTFNWPEGHTVRVWVEDTLDMPMHTQAGIDTWKNQFLYQEFDATIVSDSTTADVLVGVSIPPAAVQAVRLGASAPECAGVTTFPPLAPDNSIVLPFHVQIIPRTLDLTSPAAVACYELTVTHELGHTMGLFRHSTNANDLMFTDPVVAGPSARDRNTVQQLYHVDADLTAHR
jgi:hypothetical protein